MERTSAWDDRTLLLLGVLMNQSQHGYQINDFIERALCDVATMKKPTAYAVLDRLASAGHISVHTEQEGNRPPRKVYSITESGRDLFGRLLRENLAAFDAPTFAGDIGLMFLNYLPLPEAVTALRERLARIEALLATTVQMPPHHNLSIDLALDHLTALRRADRDWLRATIATLDHRLAAEQATSDS